MVAGSQNFTGILGLLFNRMQPTWAANRHLLGGGGLEDLRELGVEELCEAPAQHAGVELVQVSKFFLVVSEALGGEDAFYKRQSRISQ